MESRPRPSSVEWATSSVAFIRPRLTTTLKIRLAKFDGLTMEKLSLIEVSSAVPKYLPPPTLQSVSFETRTADLSFPSYRGFGRIASCQRTRRARRAAFPRTLSILHSSLVHSVFALKTTRRILTPESAGRCEVLVEDVDDAVQELDHQQRSDLRTPTLFFKSTGQVVQAHSVSKAIRERRTVSSLRTRARFAAQSSKLQLSLSLSLSL